MSKVFNENPPIKPFVLGSEEMDGVVYHVIRIDHVVMSKTEAESVSLRIKEKVAQPNSDVFCYRKVPERPLYFENLYFLSEQKAAACLNDLQEELDHCKTQVQRLKAAKHEVEILKLETALRSTLWEKFGSEPATKQEVDDAVLEFLDEKNENPIAQYTKQKFFG